MNVKLLRKVQKHILEEPKRLDMDHVLIRKGDLFTENYDFPKCGTIGCIAGWACVLNGEQFGGFAKAEILLGLSPEQRQRLFTEPRAVRSGAVKYGWPETFNRRYFSAKSQKQRAKVTAERIDHFIKTKGAE